VNDGIYQLVFEAVIGTSWSSDMAIDDIIITPGECQPPGGCDFEDVSELTLTSIRFDNFCFKFASISTRNKK